MANKSHSGSGELEEFLAQRRVARELAIMQDAYAAQIPYVLKERAASNEAILGMEAIALSQRMRWLFRHPKRPRLLGGSAVKMSGEVRRPPEITMSYGDVDPEPDTVVSPLILASEPETIEDSIVYDGYVFSTSAHPSRRSLAVLGITHWFVDRESGERHKMKGDRYGITVHGAPTSVSRIAITGPGFSDHDLRVHTQSIEAFAQEGRAAYEAVQAEANSYPEEFYRLPLGLVAQAHNELGRRH